MKHCKKTIALLLSIVMTLSLFSIVGFAEEGDTPAGSYTVTFYDRANGEGNATIVSEQTVAAGASATDPLAGITDEATLKTKLHYPDDPTDSFMKQGFDGWDKSFSNVTANLRIFPKFKQVPKMYQITYKNWDGTELNSENCLYGEQLEENSHPSRADDLAYYYTFKGWSLKQVIDPVATPDDAKYLLDWTFGLNLPDDETLGQVKGSPDYINLYGDGIEEPIPVTVYAYFARFKLEYPLSLTVVDQYDNRIAGADVQVLGANSQFLDQTIAQTDEDGNLTGLYKIAAGKTDENGRIYMRLPYQTEYTIQVSYGDYAGAKIKKTYISEFKDQGLTIQLESAAQYNEENKPRCTCVCHSVIGGVWVTMLNVMYYLFKVKYVCCYDLYATHGSKLAYGG